MQTPDNYAPLPVALVLISASVMGPLLSACRARLRAKTARAIAQQQGVEAERVGVLTGIVEYDEGRELAVRVEVTQVGEESESSGSFSWRWREVGRRVQVAPFFLVRDDGERVRVEPDMRTALVDDMDGKVFVDDRKRKRVAELVSGERVWVVGDVRGQRQGPASGAYRQHAGERVVHPFARKGLFISSHPLDEPARERAQFHGGWATLFGALSGLGVLASTTFFERLFLGVTARGRIESVRQKTNDDGDVTGYETRVKSEQGAPRPFDITGTLDAQHKPGESYEVRLGPVSEQLGGEAALNFWLPGAIIVAYVVLAFVAQHRRTTTLPWYRRKFDESGSGKLNALEN
jgi:hypothetical protein